MNVSTFIICAVLVVIGVCAILSYKKKLKNGCCGTGGGDIKIAPSDTNESHYAHKAVISIGGMTCQNCAIRIENAFNRREGFMVKVNLRKKQAELWSKTKADENDIRRTIQGMDYSVIGIVIKK